MAKVQKLGLTTLKSGAVMEMFDEELKKVLGNIADNNTVADKTRTITITLTIKPDKARRAAEIKTQVKSTLAGVRPTEGVVVFDIDEAGKFQAYEEPDEQTPDFPEIAAPAAKAFKEVANA